MDCETIKQNILKKFIYNEKLKYNEIWDKKVCTSSLFDYHFKKILNDGIIQKENDYYKLTSKGISKISNLDGKKITKVKQPLVCSNFIVQKDDKFLFCKRNKQPFINFLGVGGGKLEFGLTSKEQTQKELYEETNLIGEGKLKVIAELITKNKNNETIHHTIIFFYLFKNVKGELVADKREGEFLWLTLEELKNYKTFPEVEKNIKLAMKTKTVKHYINYRQSELLD